MCVYDVFLCSDVMRFFLVSAYRCTRPVPMITTVILNSIPHPSPRSPVPAPAAAAACTQTTRHTQVSTAAHALVTSHALEQIELPSAFELAIYMDSQSCGLFIIFWRKWGVEGVVRRRIGVN